MTRGEHFRSSRWHLPSQQEVAHRRLKDLTIRLQKDGYKPDQIKSELLQRRYDPHSIDRALNELDATLEISQQSCINDASNWRDFDDLDPERAQIALAKAESAGRTAVWLLRIMAVALGLLLLFFVSEEEDEFGSTLLGLAVLWPLSFAVFLIWLHRVRSNLSLLGVSPEYIRHSEAGRPIVSLIAWFIPILNLFWPYLIVKETWKMSCQYCVEDGRPEFELWWFSWLAAVLLNVAPFGIWANITALVLLIVSVINATIIIRSILSRQRRQVDAIVQSAGGRMRAG